jgi:hypothetical protein
VGLDDSFPLDRQWICATNALTSEVNANIQAWRGAGHNCLGTIYAVTDLVSPLPEAPGLSICQQRDFLEHLDAPDLPVYALCLYEGDPLVLLRNLDTSLGLAQGRRCSAKFIRNRTVVVCFDQGEERTLTRVPLEKVTNGMNFKRWQVPLRLMYAGTVHRSQGMTLSRAVVDCRSEFWEHGQLYVALSRVRDPRELCILLPKDKVDPPIKIPIDPDVVKIVRQMSVPETDQFDSECVIAENSDAAAQQDNDLALLVHSTSSDEDYFIVRAMENMNEVCVDEDELTESEASVTNANVEIDGIDSNTLVSGGF